MSIPQTHLNGALHRPIAHVAPPETAPAGAVRGPTHSGGAEGTRNHTEHGQVADRYTPRGRPEEGPPRSAAPTPARSSAPAGAHLAWRGIPPELWRRISGWIGRGVASAVLLLALQWQLPLFRQVPLLGPAVRALEALVFFGWLVLGFLALVLVLVAVGSGLELAGPETAHGARLNQPAPRRRG